MPDPQVILALVVLVIAVINLAGSWRPIQPIFWVWLCLALLALIVLWDPLVGAWS